MNLSFWASVMCQEETSESLEGVSPGGVINHGKNLLKRQVMVTSNGEVLTKELTLWYSLWYWNHLSD